MAAAVISASELPLHVHSIWHEMPVLVTVLFAGLFMGITILGIESRQRRLIGIFLPPCSLLLCWHPSAGFYF